MLATTVRTWSAMSAGIILISPSLVSKLRLTKTAPFKVITPDDYTYLENQTTCKNPVQLSDKRRYPQEWNDTLDNQKTLGPCGVST